jgi:hypothetical protein
MPATVKGKINVLVQQNLFFELSFLGRFLPFLFDAVVLRVEPEEVGAYLLFIVVVNVILSVYSIRLYCFLMRCMFEGNIVFNYIVSLFLIKEYQYDRGTQ